MEEINLEYQRKGNLGTRYMDISIRKSIKFESISHINAHQMAFSIEKLSKTKKTE
jgi:hypothetical protein